MFYIINYDLFSIPRNHFLLHGSFIPGKRDHIIKRTTQIQWEGLTSAINGYDLIECPVKDDLIHSFDSSTYGFIFFT